MINNGLQNVVKITNNIFVDMHNISPEKLEAFFYFVCYQLGENELADKTLKATHDHHDKINLVVRAWSISYCRLGEKTKKKVTNKKAKKMFSRHLNVIGDFVETGVDRLWLFIENKQLRNLPNDSIAVLVPLLESFIIMKRSELTEYSIFSANDLNDLHNKLISNDAIKIEPVTLHQY